jgi:hypothetical protein
MIREHDDRGFHVTSFYLFEDIETRPVGERDVENNNMGNTVVEHSDGFNDGPSLTGD